ncbi:MAG: ORF6C domain-containing protein [Anaerolineales bacterium]|nr:ORF6C domain-containing protein [Anaerolineales bacterium]
MTETKSLVAVEHREVAFYEDTVVAVRLAGGDIYVPIRPICDNLGVTLAGQRERINRDPVLAEAVTSVSVTLTQQAREMLCLPLKYIPGWLFGMNANRVKPALRDRIIRYQRECYDVLFAAFSEGRLTTDPTFDDLLAADSPAVQAYKMAAAIMQMARQQILLEAQLGAHAARLDAYEERLELVESTLGDSGRYVTPDQAMQISQAVKVIALEQSKRTRKNEYGAVYGQLYRQFAITSYKQLPANRFDEAMTWLTDWYKHITGATGPDDVPF